ncbi:NAD(P)-binding protein [Trichophaea hybrida]|nr:NAD(P)-binding protein [Trichophaea hybrida]
MSSSSSPDRKSVLITGAGIGGIGGELAKQFHSQGYRVFAAFRRAETIAELESLGIESVYIDVTDQSSITAAHATISSLTGGKLNVLVNNAGQSVPRPAVDLEIETTVKGIFDVNVFGVMRMVQTFVDMLVSAAEAGEDATVVNIGSIAPILPIVFGAGYNASKAALHAYADCLRMELKPFNVHVLTVITGGVRSSIVRQQSPVLPADSMYHPLTEYYWSKRVNMSQAMPMATADYAASVVRQVVRGNKRPWFWEGYFSWMAWAIDTFLWKGFTDWEMSRRYGLLKLTDMVKEQRRAKVKQN